jgi:hypothetical protein
MPKQITQAELRAVLKLNGSLNQRMLEIRNRIARGATVEDGELAARADEEEPDYSPFAPGLYGMGLDIMATTDFHKSQALLRKWQDLDAAETRSKIVLIRAVPEVAHA